MLPEVATSSTEAVRPRPGGSGRRALCADAEAREAGRGRSRACAAPRAAGPLTRRPPVRREFRHKRNITFNDNDTVSYREYRNFQFQPDMSNGLESDYIVMPNILALVRLPRRPARAPCPRPAARTRLARRGPFAGPACGSGPTPPGEFPRTSTASGLGVLAKVLSFPWQSTNLKCPGGANGRRRGTPRAVSLCHCGEGASRASELCSESQQ